MFKKENGITLVALVVTIVVLLILAGVSISLVLGNNGIIKKAKDAKTQTNTKVKEENTFLTQLNDEQYFNNLVNGQ